MTSSNSALFKITVQADIVNKKLKFVNCSNKNKKN